MLRMTREDLVRFATRDWAAIDGERAAFWIDRKRRMSPADVLSLGDDLRRHASIVRPNWPTAADRSADLATHERVTEALRAVTHVGVR
jgi:hypothetical protein